MDTSSPLRGRYGIDRPAIAIIFATLIVLAVVFAVIGLAGDEPSTAIGPLIATCFFGIGLGVVLRSTKIGKPRLWRGLLDDLDLQGDEQILDVGCGRGLVLVMAARRLTTGHAAGIDLWRSRDQSGNTIEACEANLVTDDVADRTTVMTADTSTMPFEDEQFDLVLASLSLRAIQNTYARERALQEMVRVLEPGGRLVIADIGHIDSMVTVLEGAGLRDIKTSPPNWATYPPVRVITAHKGDGRPRR